MTSKSAILKKKYRDLEKRVRQMLIIEELEETQEIIRRRQPAPSLSDLTPELIKKLEIKSPADLFYALDRLLYLWANDKISRFQTPDE